MKFGAAPPGGYKAIPGDVLARTAAADIVVFQRHAAEREDQLAVSDHLVPAYITAGDDRLRPDDVRQQHTCGPGAVTVDRADIAAGQVEKAVELMLRVVETPGA